MQKLRCGLEVGRGHHGQGLGSPGQLCVWRHVGKASPTLCQLRQGWATEPAVSPQKRQKHGSTGSRTPTRGAQVRYRHAHIETRVCEHRSANSVHRGGQRRTPRSGGHTRPPLLVFTSAAH